MECCTVMANCCSSTCTADPACEIEPNSTIAQANIFVNLANLDTVQRGASPATEFVKLPYFGFDAEAQELFITWATELNLVRIPAEPSPLMRQHLGKYERLFGAIALILHLASGGVGSVTVESAARAAAWCEYLEGHARRIYALAEVGKINAAELLARRIREGKLNDGFTVRDVTRKGWTGLKANQEAESAIALLEEHSWLVAAESENATGRPTTKFYANPRVRSEAA